MFTSERSTSEITRIPPSFLQETSLAAVRPVCSSVVIFTSFVHFLWKITGRLLEQTANNDEGVNCNKNPKYMF